MLPFLWEQFEKGPFLFQDDCAPVHKTSSIKACWIGLVWKNWTDLHRALNSDPKNVLRMNGQKFPQTLLEILCKAFSE